MRTTILSLLAVTLGASLWGAARLGAEPTDEDAEFARELLLCAVPPDPPGDPMLPAQPDDDEPASADGEDAAGGEASDGAQQSTPVAAIQPGRIPEFVTKGVAWLIAAQHNDGGWGGGSHAAQQVLDPHAVVTDPATTSFSLLALLRAGHTPVGGEYQAQVRKGLLYLVTAVESAPADGPLITNIEGTQPQTKLGRFVDTAMTSQYLARALSLLPKDDELYPRVDKALDVCLAKLQLSQHDDGSWGEGGGWAPVLQSSLSCSALELAQASGKTVDAAVLQRARDYQRGNYDVETGEIAADAAAGIELYAFNGAFRGNASEGAQAEDLVEAAKSRGDVADDAEVSEETLRQAGVTAPANAQKLAAAWGQNRDQMDRLADEQLLAGFGNNGGEEFLSYLMTSETLLIAGGDKFHQWQDKMQGRLAGIQNADGSWSGHHCISSPVFCTAAVVQCLTADQDAEFLLAMARRTSGESEQVAANDEGATSAAN